MLRLLIDTSVWLDIAKRRDGQRWIVPLRVLKLQRKLDLLVPSLVIEEFERNRPRAEAAVTASVRERFRLLRIDLQEYGGGDQRELIEEITHRIPLISAMTLQNFAEISDLLNNAQAIEPTDSQHAQVVRRALDKKAPFHLHKNSVADALLIELYQSTASRDTNPGNHYAFVTSNYQDFSAPNGDRRKPHPDLADAFSDDSSRYIYGADELHTHLSSFFGEEFVELSEETELVREEPRTLVEILEAEREYFDKIWYVRSLIRAEKVEDGQLGELSPELHNQVTAAMRAIEERYGPENLGPWDDWGWGFVHGKLSALRWVLGSEWDFLDT